MQERAGNGERDELLCFRRGRIKEPYGYLTGFGYKGWVDELGSYILFATEQEYKEYIGG